MGLWGNVVLVAACQRSLHDKLLACLWPGEQDVAGKYGQ